MSGLAWSHFRDVVRVADTRAAVLRGTENVNFAQLEQSAENWAAAIVAAPGERVILYTENSAATVAAALGVWRCNAVPVWVNAAAPLDHLRIAIAETEAVCVVSEKPDLTDDVACRVISEPMPDGILGGSPVGAGNNDLGSIVYTSGSTGRPKGVVQRTTTLIGGAARVSATLGFSDDERVLCPVPFAFDYGWGQLLSMAFGGMTLVLPEPNNAFGICDAITRHRPSVLAGVPAVFANLLSGLSPIRDIDCSSVRMITNTGSRIPQNVLVALYDTFPTAALSLNYGLTETYRTASLPTALAKSKPHAVGSAIDGAEIAIVHPDGTLCSANETGEIVHRGAGVFDGYWNDPERTAAVRRADPVNPSSGQFAVFTGDLGHLDDDGHLVISGRKDRQMKSMGVRVSPDEIEEILLATGQMAEVAITSRPDDMVGDMVVALVVARPESDAQADLKALKRDARAALSPYMIPRVYHLLDALPRNPNGKVDYVTLKRVAAEQMP